MGRASRDGVAYVTLDGIFIITIIIIGKYGSYASLFYLFCPPPRVAGGTGGRGGGGCNISLACSVSVVNSVEVVVLFVSGSSSRPGAASHKFHLNLSDK